MSDGRPHRGRDCDVVVVGGGLVGASLASALDGAGLRVAVIEAAGPDTAPPSYDDRPIALAYGSRRILDGLGLWEPLAPRACPIRRIHVSDRGHFGFARLDAEEEGVGALGYVTDARSAGAVLDAAVARRDGLKMLRPARVVSLEPGADAVQVVAATDAGEVRLSAGVLVAADGGRSTVRGLLGVDASETDYGQVAVTANVTPRRHHQHVAYERFTPTGPMALLPMHDHRCGLVWTVRPERASELMDMDDAVFLAALSGTFGTRLGAFTRVGQRAAYPLRMVRSREQVRGRVVIAGNAAHTLHPVAGQGFNLSLRDVAALAEVLVDAVRAGEDPGADGVLARYLRWRSGDQRVTTLATDGLVRVFSNRLAPLVLARNLGLVGLDLVPAFKSGFARQAMGLAGRQPRLARGLEL